MATRRRPGVTLLRHLLLALAVLAPLTPSPLRAQACLGFGGDGFLGPSGALRQEWSENIAGIGGAGGLRVGPVVAAAHYMKFSGADKYDQEFDFQSVRATVGYELGAPSLSLCPVLTFGSEGVSSWEYSSYPYRSKPFFGAGLALGNRFTGPDSGVAIIPSLVVTVESHVVEDIIEGDISIDDRRMGALLHGGVTLEFGRLFVRPWAALIAVENGWRTGGMRFGLRF